MDIIQYALVDKQTNIVVGSCMWDGNRETWTPPEEYILVPEEATEALHWYLNAEDKQTYSLQTWVNKPLGGVIGFTFDGTKFITNEPQPEPRVQPATSGMQTI